MILVFLGLDQAKPSARVTSVSHPAVPKAVPGSRLPYEATATKVPMDETVAQIGGSKVRFRGNQEFDKVSVQAVGRDGTVLLYRSAYGLYSTYQNSIVHGSVEVPVRAFGHEASVDRYLGAHDFAGSFYEDESQNGNSMRPPWVPPVAFVVEHGRYRKVGRGDVIAWEPGGTVVTTLLVNAAGRPAYWEEDHDEHVWLDENHRTFDLGEVRYIGRQGAGFVFTDSSGGVFVWGRGRLQPWARLPNGYKAIATDGRSRLLAREDDTWNFGFLKGGIFSPLRLARPPKAAEINLDAPLSFPAERKLPARGVRRSRCDALRSRL